MLRKVKSAIGGGSLQVAAPVKSVQLEAVVIRKDGTREELGTIAYWNKKWHKRFAFKINHFFNNR